MRREPVEGLPAAVLWDMDGTLVDTEPYWIAAEHALVAEYGGRWSEELGLHLVGNDLLTSAEFIRAHSPVDLDPVAIVERLVDDVVARIRVHVPWRPGSLELLGELRAADVPCALVTMSWARLAAAVVASLPEPLYGAFAVVLTGDQVTHGKPHPEPYRTAAARLGVDPARCVAIEDSHTGVRSALAAGVPTIAVRHVVPVPEDLGAVVIDSLADVRVSELSRLAAAAASRC